MSVEQKQDQLLPLWEYSLLVSSNIRGSGGIGAIFVDASGLWTKKDKEGKTTFDEMVELGSQGWELVEVTPLAESGMTTQLLFSFKRPALPELRETTSEEAIRRAGEPPGR